MKKAAIQAAVEEHLAALGFAKGTYLWQPLTAELILMVGSTMKKIKLKSGMSRRALTFELGRISGWADVLLQPAPKPNGNGAHRNWAEVAQSIGSPA